MKWLVVMIAWVASAQTVQVVDGGISPSGDRPLAPSCTTPAACLERDAIAALDGFGLDPLIRVRFNAPVDLESARHGIHVVYGRARHRSGFTTYPEGHRMPINQVAWEPSTLTLYAKPEQPLEHDREYRIEVTAAVKDLRGQAVVPASSMFHTRNVVASLLSQPLGPVGTVRRTVAGEVDLSTVSAIKTRTQVSTNPNDPLVEAPFPAEIPFILQLGLRRMIFFEYQRRTGSSIQVVHGHALLPSGPAPAQGYDIVIIGHGLGDSRLFGPSLLASGFLANSAVVAIDAVGHGFGPLSQVRFERDDGSVLDVAVPGRARDLDGNGQFDATEGCIVAGPGRPTYLRDCLRETALDLAQLARELRAGMDLGGGNFNRNRIQYVGQSLGAMYGTLFGAIAPELNSLVLNVGGGSSLEISRSSSNFQPLLAAYLAATHPDTLNADGTLPDPRIERWQNIAVLSPLQARYLEALDRMAMLEDDGAPAAFAPFLKQATLFGHATKPTLFQYAIGDQTVPNSANLQLIRAAYEYELVSVYRHDLARQIAPALPVNPHIFMAAFASFDPQSLVIGLAALQQANGFFANNGAIVPDPNRIVRLLFGRDLFESPAFTVNFL